MPTRVDDAKLIYDAAKRILDSEVIREPKARGSSEAAMTVDVAGQVTAVIMVLNEYQRFHLGALLRGLRGTDHDTGDWLGEVLRMLDLAGEEG